MYSDQCALHEIGTRRTGAVIHGGAGVPLRTETGAVNTNTTRNTEATGGDASDSLASVESIAFFFLVSLPHLAAAFPLHMRM